MAMPRIFKLFSTKSIEVPLHRWFRLVSCIRSS